jgi:hypothetical protein
MGLLEDAIQEHLQLKRLRGVDPSEVTRQEGEALGVVRREEADSSSHAVDFDAARATNYELSASGGVEASRRDPADVGQETVELDMRTLLEEESLEHASGSQSDPPAATMRAARIHARAKPHASGKPHAPGDLSTADPLEWGFSEEPERNFDTRLREPERAPKTIDEQGMPAGEVLAEAQDASFDASSQEHLWLDRRQAHSFDLGR